jgi:hypothetical protein
MEIRVIRGVSGATARGDLGRLAFIYGSFTYVAMVKRSSAKLDQNLALSQR